MKTKLERIVYPALAGWTVVLLLGYHLWQELDGVTANYDKEWADCVANESQQIQNSANVAYNAIKTIQPTIATTVTAIHKQLATKTKPGTKHQTTTFYGDNVAYYRHYRYNYLIFTHLDNSHSDIVQEYSSLANSKFNSKFNQHIIDTYSGMLAPESSYLQTLTNGQLAYKLTTYDNVVYILSAAFVPNKRGQTAGSTVVVMLLSEFIKLRDFVLNTNNANLFIGDDELNTIYSNDLNDNHKTLKTILDKEGRALTQARPLPTLRTDIINGATSGFEVMFAANYYQPLNVLVLAYSCHAKPQAAKAFTAKTIIAHGLAILLLLAAIRTLVRRSGHTINRTLSLLKRLLTTTSTPANELAKANAEALALSIIDIAEANKHGQHANISIANYLAAAAAKASSKLVWPNYNKYRHTAAQLMQAASRRINTEKELQQKTNSLQNIKLAFDRLLASKAEDSTDIGSQTSPQAMLTALERQLKAKAAAEQSLQTVVTNNNNLELTANLLEINLAILTSQTGDSRLAELLSQLKTYKWNLRENNNLLQTLSNESSNASTISQHLAAAKGAVEKLLQNSAASEAACKQFELEITPLIDS